MKSCPGIRLNGRQRLIQFMGQFGCQLTHHVDTGHVGNFLLMLPHPLFGAFSRGNILDERVEADNFSTRVDIRNINGIDVTFTCGFVRHDRFKMNLDT